MVRLAETRLRESQEGGKRRKKNDEDKEVMEYCRGKSDRECHLKREELQLRKREIEMKEKEKERE